MSVPFPIPRALSILGGAFRAQVGLPPMLALAMLLLLAVAGAGLAALFPKYQATALLQTPQDPATATLRRLPSAPSTAVVTLPEFKRAMAAIASTERLTSFLTARGRAEVPAGQRLLIQSRNPGFWEAAASPAYPISRRDQREIGDVRDQSAPAGLLLGIALTADARAPATAQEMAQILGDYVADGVALERARAWIAAGRREAETASRTLRADLLKLQTEIEQTALRVVDTKAILARYPDASRLEGRQVLGVNPTDGSDRFLSPLAQLVSLESLMSQQRERSRLAERELKQSEALLAFFTAAGARVQAAITFDGLVQELQPLLATSFPGGAAGEAWLVEAGYRTAAVVGYLQQWRVQLAQRSEGGAEVRSLRSPVAFAALFAVLGMMLIGAIALLRVAAAYVDRQRVAG